MNSEMLKQILGVQDLTVLPSDLGITNRNYRILSENREWIWRRPASAADSLGTSRRTEAQVMERAAALDVPVLWFDEKTGEKVSRRVKAQEFGQSADPGRFCRAGKLVSALHRLSPVDQVFDPFARLDQYRTRCTDLVLPAGWEEVTDAAKRLWVPDTLCHNDLVAGNILLGEDRDWLIDYEYAARGDWRFDLASFLSENQVLDPKDRQDFLSCFSRPVTEQEVILFELVADLIWASWAQMLLEQRKEPVFQQIRDDKLRHFEIMKNKLVDIQK